MIILLDNGHGSDTPGKRSPDGHFREYAYNRYLAFLIRERLITLGLDAQLLVPEREAISLKERCRRFRISLSRVRNAGCRAFAAAGSFRAVSIVPGQDPGYLGRGRCAADPLEAGGP